MKNWQNAEIEVLDVKNTAFGVLYPDLPDSEKEQVERRDTEGWVQRFGNPDSKVVEEAGKGNN